MSRKLFWSVLGLLTLLGGTAPAYAGEKWAVIVGVNDYGSSIPHLQYAVADAKRLYGLMTKSAPADHIILLATGEAGALPPTGVNISKSVARLAAQARPDDEFWFCFSGHGEDQNGAHYLLPSDASVSDYKNTAINLKDLRDSLAQTCQAHYKLLVVDACHSGWDDLSDGRRGVGTGVTTLWASCGARESSWEIPALGEGVFTWFFLKKQAEIAPTGIRIPTKDDADAINTHVETYIRRNKQPFTQTPQVIGALPRGGLIQVDPTGNSQEENSGGVSGGHPLGGGASALQDPPGDLLARDPLGPAILVDLPDTRTQLNGTTVKSEIALALLRKDLMAHNFPLVDPHSARQLETMLNPKTAAAKAKALGARFLIRGRAETEATKLALTGSFITVQATMTAEIIDEKGNVLAQAVVGSTQDEPVAGSDITEKGAATIALTEAARQMTDALLPKLRAILAQQQATNAE